MKNLFLLIAFLYTTVHQSVFIQPVWVTSNYFRAGNEAVINSLTGSSVTPMYTFTFSSALPGIPNLGYGIKNYEGTSAFIGRQWLFRPRTILDRESGSDSLHLQSFSADCGRDQHLDP